MYSTVPASEVRAYLPQSYRKTKAITSEQAPGQFNVTSYWDGGSKDDFTLIRGGKSECVSKSPGFPATKSQYIDVQSGDVIVRTGIFNGKTATAHVHFIRNPEEQSLAA